MQGAAGSQLPEFLCDRKIRGSLRCSTDFCIAVCPFNLEIVDRRLKWRLTCRLEKQTAKFPNPCNKKAKSSWGWQNERFILLVAKPTQIIRPRNRPEDVQPSTSHTVTTSQQSNSPCLISPSPSHATEVMQLNNPVPGSGSAFQTAKCISQHASTPPLQTRRTAWPLVTGNGGVS